MSHPVTEYRKRHGMTLEAFGALLGVQKSAVNKWESWNGPKPATAMAIERLTKGEVSAASLRPDIWGAPGEDYCNAAAATTPTNAIAQAKT